MCILGRLRATSLVWTETEVPGGWNRIGKKPLYMLCDWQWSWKGTLPWKGMWGEERKMDTARMISW